MATLSTRISDNTSKKLDELAEATKRSRAYLAAEAVDKYVEEQSWQMEAITEGIKEADKGNFATDEEVKEFFAKRGINVD